MEIPTGTYKLTDHRGNKRLWIEGQKLIPAGFDKGTLFTAHFNKGQIELVAEYDGDRIVSGRKRKDKKNWTPIIDISSAEIANCLPGANRVKVYFHRDHLTIVAEKD